MDNSRLIRILEDEKLQEEILEKCGSLFRQRQNGQTTNQMLSSLRLRRLVAMDWRLSSAVAMRRLNRSRRLLKHWASSWKSSWYAMRRRGNE